jgi:N-acetyl-anhydromuramyl-L-alanine amidase AmpD
MTREIDHLIIHCAATPPTADIGAADIDRWHRQRGWWGNGYHAVIRRNGETETVESGHRCRPLDRAGAHVGDCGPGWNRRSIGVCLAGGVDTNNRPANNFTDAQWKALEEYVLTMLERFPSIHTIGGHRDLIAKTGAPPKACPSFAVTDWWRNEVLPKYPDVERFQSIKLLVL